MEKKKKLTAEVSQNLFDRVGQFCDDNGFVQQRVLAAGVEAFMVLPASLQVLLLQGKSAQVKLWLDERERAFAAMTVLESSQKATQSPEAHRPAVPRRVVGKQQ